MTASPQGDSTSATTSGLRASDADREAVVGRLHEAVAKGLLTIEECDERVAAAYAARLVRDLPPLTADLPPAVPLAPVAPGWGALFALAWLQLRTAVAQFTWRGAVRSVRARPRLAVAAVALLALLSVGAISAGPLFGGDGPDHDGYRIERFEHVGPH